jgi:AcrR family transcriptional regulator
MSGKPQFDEAAVMAAAINVFWRHGYAAASISDLMEATGLSRSSIYQRFGDKDGMFLEALRGYTERVLRRMKVTRADSARGQLEALLRNFLPGESVSDRPAGCLIARSCIEAAELTDAGRAAAVKAATQQREIILDILRMGVRNQELASDADVDALAWFYLSTLHAVVNFPSVGANHEALDRMINIAMSAWPIGTGATQRWV